MNAKAKKNKLFIDGQVFQTDAWNRGMGKYSLGLLSTVHDSLKKNYSHIYIITNDGLPLKNGVKKSLMSACPSAEIISLSLQRPSSKKTVKNLQPINQDILDEYIDSHAAGQKVDFLLLCLFLDEACAVFPSKTTNYLLFYDLIPYLYHDRYRSRINFSDYLQHFKTIYEADKIFTISQTVSDDMEIYLGINRKRLVNIDGASIDRSKVNAKKPSFDIPEKFILMPSGDELRKNNLRAARGFELFNKTHNDKYKLIVTSRFSDHSRDEMKKYSESIIFTGNIPEEELQWLYENSELVLFASEYEGLGLPILEAMTVKKKITCSNIPVFREISEDALFFFDHLNPDSIANTLDSSLLATDWSAKEVLYKDILAKYSWQKTGEKFIDGIKKISKYSDNTKERIAILTPHPEGFSAIGKVVAESHEALSELYDIDYYFDYGIYHRPVRPDFLSSLSPCYDATEFNASRYADYDAVVYHIGNSDYHLESIKNALHLPGVIILHDTNLEGAFQSLERSGYITEQRKDLEVQLNKINKSKNSSFLTSVVNNQLGVIAHSKYAARAVSGILTSDVNVCSSNLPVSSPILLKSKNEIFKIGLAGIIADVKGLEVIEQIASDDRFVDCEINIFGHNFAKPDVVDQFKKWSNVHVIPNPTDFEFQTKLSSLDALVNYRLEYRGETSLTVLEAMRYGVAAIVRDIGWYSELPDDCVVKVRSIQETIDALSTLKEDKVYLGKVQVNAKRLIEKDFTHTQYASLIRQAITENSKKQLSNYLIHELVKAYSSRREILQSIE